LKGCFSVTHSILRPCEFAGSFFCGIREDREDREIREIREIREFKEFKEFKESSH
jgi:hypothetical protein